ncbi:MAG: flavodoxin [Clostridiales bacterium]|nr:flavodoxin [Clostridiales bacterium]
MSTLIAYSTKHGFTKKCAEALAEKMQENTTLCNLDKDRVKLDQFDKVIVGGSVYMGKMRKAAAEFCANNLEALKGKKLGLFICGMAEGTEADKELENSFPRELLERAAAKEVLGGAFEFEKMGFFERIIIKKISGLEQTQIKLREENLEKLALSMKDA